MSGSTGGPRCILLLVDGLRADVAEAQLAAGALPNLAAMVRTGGAQRAITSFPSTTSVAYLPFLAGRTPGSCNIPSIRWLDRRRYGGRWWRERDAVRSYCGYQAGKLDADIDAEVRTIFELVPESLAIFTMISRGLTPARDPAQRARRFWGAVAHFAGSHIPCDAAVAKHLLREIEGPWRFIFAQFPAVDGCTHASGPDSPRTLRALHGVDHAVGLVRDALARRGELDDTLMLLVSDHGASAVHTHFDLADWFRAQGVPTMSHPVIWTRAPRAAVMVAGNGSAMVYAQPDRSRRERWPMDRLRMPDAFGTSGDIVAALVSEPAVAFVAAENGSGGLRIVSAGGTADVVTTSDGEIGYRPALGDPLELGNAWEGSAAEWLARRWDSPYPDAAHQLLDLFRSTRTGDLVVAAREGYDLRRRFEYPEHKAGHGSMVRSHMHTPLWASRPLPGVPMRTVDVFPAMLDWLRVARPSELDGCAVWLPGKAAACDGTPAAPLNAPEAAHRG